MALAAAELSRQPDFAYHKGQVVFTEHFLGISKAGLVVPYRKIFWAYKMQQPLTFRYCIFLHTADRQTASIVQARVGKKSREQFQKLWDELVSRCPQMLTGDGPSKMDRYQQRVDYYKQHGLQDRSQAGQAE